MPSELTEVTEVATALGMLTTDLDAAVARPPTELRYVTPEVWDRLRRARSQGLHRAAFDRAFDNGRAFRTARAGLRDRPPILVEWKGPHRPPGDDVIPADLRVDHVYLVSCKYLSKVLLNPSPARLFDELLVGEGRTPTNWYATVAPREYAALYDRLKSEVALTLPDDPGDMTRLERRSVTLALRDRLWPHKLRPLWSSLCDEVAARSAERWTAAASSPRNQLRVLWRMLRVTSATYFVLGATTRASVRLRVDSAWDWMQAFELKAFSITPRVAGQPEVGWEATVRVRGDGSVVTVRGHVEVRWSHGRFGGAPEAKVYLDSPLSEVPGYHLLR